MEGYMSYRKSAHIQYVYKICVYKCWIYLFIKMSVVWFLFNYSVTVTIGCWILNVSKCCFLYILFVVKILFWHDGYNK